MEHASVEEATRVARDLGEKSDALAKRGGKKNTRHAIELARAERTILIAYGVEDEEDA
jgi:hypothetical protein